MLLHHLRLVDLVVPVGVGIGNVVGIARLCDTIRIGSSLAPLIDDGLRVFASSADVLTGLVYQRHIVGIVRHEAHQF